MSTRLPLQVLIYCYREIDNNREWLLLKRTPEHGGFWQGVTGGIELNEKYLDAATREVVEETGIQPLAIHDIDYSYSFPVPTMHEGRYATQATDIQEFVFVAQCAYDSIVILSDEHDDFSWVSQEQAQEMLYWKENKEAFEHATKFS